MNKIKKISVGRLSFVPDVVFDTTEGRINNKDLLSTAQVLVYYKLPTEAQSRKWISVKQKNGKKGRSVTEYDTDRLSAVRSCVESVKGLEGVFEDKDGKDIIIKDGETLAAHHNVSPEVVAIFRQSFDHILGMEDDEEDFTH